jgi:phage tail sheath gpL-like
MSIQRLIIDTPETVSQFDSICPLAGDKRQGGINLGNYIHSLSAGVKSADLKANVGAVKATATITFTGAPSDNETCSIGNVTFTAKTSGATGNEFNIGTSVAITASNLANAINANTTLNKFLTASSNAGVVTLTCEVPGLIGNALQLSEALSNATAVAFANGSDGTLHSYSY